MQSTPKRKFSCKLILVVLFFSITYRKTLLERLADRTETQSQWKNLVIPYTASISKKLKQILEKHYIPVFFQPTNTLRWSTVHPKDQTPKHKSNVIYAVQFSEECLELDIGETKQPLHKRLPSTGPQDQNQQYTVFFRV